MSDTPSHGPVKSIMPKWVRGPQDFVGGLALMAIAAVRPVGVERPAGHARIFVRRRNRAAHVRGLAAAGLGVAMTVVGLVTEGPQIANYAWRGPLFVSLAILSFAITIRPLGLVISAFVSFMISALGTPETRWKETIIVGICLTIGCSLLFPYALGLPLQLLPRFLIQ